MKKTLIAMAVTSALAAPAAYADFIITNGPASLQVYGVLDAAAGQEQHSLDTSSTFPGTVNPVNAQKRSANLGSTTGLFNGGISDSRIGVKGEYDLGSGTKAFFTLEQGINITTGETNDAATSLAVNALKSTTASANSSLNGQFANRQAFVGVSNDTYGSLAVGRNYAPIYDIAVKYDPVQNAQLFSPIGYSGTYGGGGGVSEDTRVDNSLKYAKKFGNFNVGGLYKLGGTSGSKSANSAYALNLGYDNGKFGVQTAYQVFKDAVAGYATGSATGIAAGSALAAPAGYTAVAGANTAQANAVGVKVLNTAAFMVAAKYAVTSKATVKIGYENYTFSAPTNPGVATNVPSYYGQTVSIASYFTGTQQKTNIVFVGGDYNLTEKLNLAVGYYDISSPQSTDKAQKSSDTRFASTLLDYRFNKNLDVYAGYMRGMYHDAANFANYTNNDIKAVGVRLKF